MKILLVDHISKNRQQIRKILEKGLDGCHVLAAASVLEGLPQIRRHHPSVAVIGYDLPEASLVEVVSLIRKSSSNLPVVVFAKKTARIQLPLSAEMKNVSIVAFDAKFSDCLVHAVKNAHFLFEALRENERLQQEAKKGELTQQIAEVALNSTHRINESLTAILGNAQLLLKECRNSSKSVLAKLHKIESAAQRIREISLEMTNALAFKGVETKPQLIAKERQNNGST